MKSAHVPMGPPRPTQRQLRDAFDAGRATGRSTAEANPGGVAPREPELLAAAALMYADDELQRSWLDGYQSLLASAPTEVLVKVDPNYLFLIGADEAMVAAAPKIVETT